MLGINSQNSVQSLHQTGVNSQEPLKLPHKDAIETGERSHIEDEGAGAASRRNAGMQQSNRSMARLSSLGIKSEESSANSDAKKIDHDSSQALFIDDVFHNEFLTAINDKIIMSQDRQNGVVKRSSNEGLTRTAVDVVKHAAKVGIEFAAGVLLSPLASIAIEAGMDTIGRLSKTLLSHYYKRKAGTIMDRLKIQFEKDPGHSLSAYRTSYAYSEMIVLNFYEKYSAQLVALKLNEQSDKEKQNMAKKMMMAIFSESNIIESKKYNGDKALVECAEEKILEIFNKGTRTSDPV